MIGDHCRGSRGQHWMWVARVLERSDEYKRRRTCLSCKAANSKKLFQIPQNRWHSPCCWLRNSIKSSRSESPESPSMAPDRTKLWANPFSNPFSQRAAPERMPAKTSYHVTARVFNETLVPQRRICFAGARHSWKQSRS